MSSSTTTTTITGTQVRSQDDDAEQNNTNSQRGGVSSTIKMQFQQQSLSKRWVKFESLVREVFKKYLRLISSPAGQDSVLKVVQYSLWILSRYYLTKGRQSRITGTSAATVAASDDATAKSLLALSAEISWTRYVLRFFGLPPSIDGASTGAWGMTGIKAIDDDDCFNKAVRDPNGASRTTGSSLWSSSFLDGVITSKRLGRFLAWTMIGYFPFEHAAYLQWKAPNLRWDVGRGRRRMITGRSNSSQDDICHVDKPLKNYGSLFSAWSCRFWLAFIVGDIIKACKALRRIQRLERQKDQIQLEKTDDDTDILPSSDELISVAQKQKYAIVRNLLFTLPAIGWSLPKWDTEPWLSDETMFGLCWLEALVGFYQQVQSTP
jgi:hypothetical protein